MNKYLLILCSFFISLPFAGAKTVRRSTKSVPVQHVAFTIHGFNSSPKGFCNSEKLLNRDLGRFGLLASSLEYDTKNDGKEVKDFAYTISKQIVDFFDKNDLPLETPYSFVVHSQGGLVAAAYMQRCVLKKQKGCGEFIAQNVKQLISIGTPFWGSPSANWLLKLDLSNWSNKVILPAGQVDGFGTSSKTITYMRNEFIKERNNPFWKNLKIFNIGGEANQNWLGIFGLSKILFKIGYEGEETDLVVPPTSAHLNFYYTREKPGSTATKRKFENDFVKIADQISFYPFSHISLPGSHGGMSCFREGEEATKRIGRYITKIYISLLKYDHKPNHLPSLPPARLAKPLRSFAVEVRMSTPDVLDTIRRPLTVSPEMVRVNERGSEKINRVHIKNGVTAVNRGFQTNKNYRVKPTYFHFGEFKDEYAYNRKKPQKELEARTCYTINLPGFEPKEFYLTVAPAHNSYAEVLLTRYEVFDKKPSATFKKPNGDVVSLSFVQQNFKHSKEKKPYLVVLYNNTKNMTSVENWNENRWNNFKQDTGIRNTTDILNRCFRGLTGFRNEFHHNYIYKNATDVVEEGQIDSLPDHQNIYVLGRYTDKSKNIDRYYISFTHPLHLSRDFGPGENGLNGFWIDVNDVDVSKTTTHCNPDHYPNAEPEIHKKKSFCHKLD